MENNPKISENKSAFLANKYYSLFFQFVQAVSESELFTSSEVQELYTSFHNEITNLLESQTKLLKQISKTLYFPSLDSLNPNNPKYSLLSEGPSFGYNKDWDTAMVGILNVLEDRSQKINSLVENINIPLNRDEQEKIIKYTKLISAIREAKFESELTIKFDEISNSHFKKASLSIDTDGKVEYKKTNGKVVAKRFRTSSNAYKLLFLLASNKNKAYHYDKIANLMLLSTPNKSLHENKRNLDNEDRVRSTIRTIRRELKLSAKSKDDLFIVDKGTFQIKTSIKIDLVS